MKKITSSLLLSFLLLSSTLVGQNQQEPDQELMNRVADWQVYYHYKCRTHNLDWTNGALYLGMFAWAEYTGNEKYFDFLLEVGNRNKWDLGERKYHADDFAVIQTYIKLFKKYNDPQMIAVAKQKLNYVVDNPSTAPLSMGAKGWGERWSWCDALFMAPPAFAAMNNITPNAKYLDYVDSEFKEATDSLYDHTAKLYYRDNRYIGKKEANGEKIFWGRGNGWVFAGLPLLMQELPKGHPTYNYYLTLYNQMADALLATQDQEGSWHASLLDPASYPSPENSASAFIIYGLAWGVNNGIFKDEKYKTAAQKGWLALITHVNADGKLGYVQPIGADPKNVTQDMTEVYGVGAFLLAGVEMLKMN